MRFRIVLALLAAMTAAHSAALPDYLKLRKKLGISQATTSLALRTLVGEATMEVKALVKGTFNVEGTMGLLLNVAGADPIVIKAKNIPEWLNVPHAEARLLIKAKRANDFALLDAELIAAVEEGAMKEWETKIKPAAVPKTAKRFGKRLQTPFANRGGFYGQTSTKDWNLAPNSAVPVYANFIRGYNPRLSSEKATEIAQGIIGFSVQYGVDARLITAMVLVESGFNPNSRSRAGAMGLGQLMPGTAAGMGVRNAYDTFENLWGTVRLVRGHLEKYATVGANGQKYYDLVLALAAYNAGSGAVRRAGGVPPYRETQNYVRKVTDWYGTLSGR